MRLIRYLLLMLACSAAVAGEQDITVKQGAQLNVTLTGSEGTLTGRTLRMHVRSKVGVTSTKFVASTTTGELSIASASSATLTVGADVLAAVPVTLPVEYWVYDVESYTTSADVRREFWGRVTITRDVTRDTEAATETALAGVVLYSGPQSLTTAQKLQARDNIGAGTGGGGAGTWGSITGTLTDQTDLTSALALKAPLASPTLTGTPAAPTAAGGTSTTQIATTAFTAGEITTHAGATDPHGDRAFATSAVSTHSALTTGAHGITAAGAALLDDADAAAQRTTLGLGTAATTAATAYEASGAVATHNAVTTAHGISAFGATLVDDADAATARTTLGLGTAATTAATDYATASHNHSGVYQPSDAELTAIAGLTSAADSAPYFTGSGTAALMTVTSAGRALIDDADASAQRTTLGLAIGTNVQAYDADLTTWAGITPGTGVATALAANIGSAGAVVTNGGALGTPSSGTLTNATGLPPAAITQSGATSNQVLAWNGSAWAPATPSAGSGDVVGPASATDNAIARFDATTGKLLQNSGVTVSDVSGSSVTLASSAGNALAIAATAPAATTGASVAGVAASLTAGPAVASTDTAGAAAGGSVTITAGAAARLTSGNANGGNISLVTGAGIGTGVAGQILIPDGTAAAPSIAFSTNTNTGIFHAGTNLVGIGAYGTSVITFGFNDITLGTSISGVNNVIKGFKVPVTDRTSDGTESSSVVYGGVITNAGATSLVSRTLITASAGQNVTFVCLDTDGIKVIANSGDNIRVIDKITGTAGYIQSTTIGSTVTLVAVDATTWLATSIHGVWTDGTFTYDDTSLTTP